jgi:NADH:ubiquinone oxidoreductase subunit 5 (subunit L)/multisubunit Na+/H+ antiporter MnhA subunit
MTFPLMALAVPSVLIGLVGTPFANYFEAFIHAPGEAVEPLGEVAEAFDWTEFLIDGQAPPSASASSGITLAVMMYRTKAIDPKLRSPPRSNPSTTCPKISGISTRSTTSSSSRAAASWPSRCSKLTCASSMA